MAKFSLRASRLFLFLCLASVATNAQSGNLLLNPSADLDARHWRAYGQATVEEVNGNPHFVVRNGGYFLQDVNLPEGAVGQFAVLIGRGSCERINADGRDNGFPYLHGYMMDPGEPDGGRVFAQLSGQRMSGPATSVGEWALMWGIFRVPEGAGRVRFFLNQESPQGVSRNRSAARFDDLGFYLFPTEAEAKSFVDSHG